MWCSEAVEFLTDLQSGTTYVREVSYFLILLIKTNISVKCVKLIQIYVDFLTLVKLLHKWATNT